MTVYFGKCGHAGEPPHCLCNASACTSQRMPLHRPAFRVFQLNLRHLTALPSASYTPNPPDESLSLHGSFEEDETRPPASSEPLAASDELRELAHLQLDLLISSLEARLANSVDTVTAVRCAVYSRTPGSLPSNQLQLQLIAATDGREAEAAQQRHDLILGMPEGNGQYQEAWIVEQSLIVLPDSGGLVLPLSHNGFLVGLLVVERCLSSGGDDRCTRQKSILSGLQPPASSVFGPAELSLMKQTGTALSLACAMDLRSALERTGNLLHQRQVAGLVRDVRKPLRTLRTLGAMLAPRLQHGEPERDLTDGIVAQGELLGELVSQLQAALVSPMQSAVMVPPTPTPPPAATPLTLREASSFETASTSAAQVQYPPALPSSTIGADNLGPVRPVPRHSMSMAPRASLEALRIGDDDGDEPLDAGAPPPTGTTELAPTLVPMLASASNFAAVSGVSFVLMHVDGDELSGHFTAGTLDHTAAVPDARLAIDSVVLKRMLSQLLDGTIACAARGDCIEVTFKLESWQGVPGVLAAVQLLQAIGPAGGRAASVAADDEGHIYLAEFAALSNLAQQSGGWFDVRIETAVAVVQRSVEAHSPSQGLLSAVLWLPIAPDCPSL